MQGHQAPELRAPQVPHSPVCRWGMKLHAQRPAFNITKSTNRRAEFETQRSVLKDSRTSLRGEEEIHPPVTLLVSPKLMPKRREWHLSLELTSNKGTLLHLTNPDTQTLYLYIIRTFFLLLLLPVQLKRNFRFVLIHQVRGIR